MVNMNNKLEMDLFLKQLQLLSINYNISCSQIYVQLTKYQIDKQDSRRNLVKLFSSLIEKNKDNKNMNVFVSDEYSYFCQFISKNFKFNSDLNPIKIYVPLKGKNIEKMVFKIFDFISNNNIEHYSKLAKEVRIDNLVIRVYNKDDASKIIDFINSDKELLNNMYEPNIFCIKEGKIGVTIDGNLSYNDILSKYIYSYIKLENTKKNFVSIEGFLNFLKENLNALYSKEDLSTQIKMCDKRNLTNLPLFLKSLEEITGVIIGTINNKNVTNLYKYNEYINTDKYREEKNKEYQEFDYLSMQAKNTKLLKEVYFVIAKKNGINNANNILKLYKNTKDINYITKSEDAREKLLKAKSFITYLNLIDLEKTIGEIIFDMDNSRIKNSKEIILEEICKEIYIASNESNHDGIVQVATALINMNFGNYKYVTRKNNARALAKENFKPKEVENTIRKTLESKGYIIETEEDLYYLYSMYVDNLLKCEERKREKNNAKK